MADEIEQLIRDLGKIPKELKAQLRPGLRKAGDLVRDQARRNAAWSSRIPPATKTSLSFTKNRPGVSVIVDKNKAPHARPYEHGGRPGRFRHPVYARGEDRRAWTWVPQQARPFLAPAMEAKGEAAAKQIADVVDRVTREAGFR